MPQMNKKNGQTQTKINKKYLFYRVYTATLMKRKEPWTESQNTMNNLAQANA
jgi:hypothetical protein